MPHCICLLMLTIVKGFSYSKVHCLKSGYSELGCEYEYFISRTRFYFAIHPLFINFTLYCDIVDYFFVSSFQAAVYCYSNTFDAIFKCIPSTALDSCHLLYLSVFSILAFFDHSKVLQMTYYTLCMHATLDALQYSFLKHTLWYLTVWYTGVCYSFL